MSPISDEALKNLKEKLAAISAADTVGLSGSAFGIKPAAYVFTDVSVDWDPKDHPRNPNTGEFVKSPTGYIFGLAKTATFGVNGMAKKIDLKPGDVAFKTQNGNVIVSHADGSYSLHHADKVDPIPAGSESLVAANVMDGKYTKIGENPGTVVPAKTIEDAKAKIEDPSSFQKTGPKNTKDLLSTSPGQPNHKSDDQVKPVPPSPELKQGKDKYTAKQYADYQNAAKGALLGHDENGNPVLSGSWVEYNGKPHLIHASPYGGGGITAYKWVATKQQASNLAREDILTVKGLSQAKVIDDPTGKPYGKQGTHPNSIKAEQAAAGGLKHGSLMSQAVTGPIPNTATAHKKHIESNKNVLLTTAPNSTELVKPEGGQYDFITAKHQNGQSFGLKSGDWVELEGKPFQVHASPNPGNIALGKWVSTKQQASNNTYDFPESVLKNAVLIPDPTGKPYVPLKQQKDEQQADVPTPEEIAASKKNLMDSLSQGEIAAEDLHPIVEHGSEAAKVAAQQILDDISQNEILDSPSAPKDELLADWEKALLGYAYSVDYMDSGLLKSLEPGSVVESNKGDGSDPLYFHKDGSDTYSLISGDSEGQWATVSTDEAATALNQFGDIFTVLPNGDEAKAVFDNPVLQPYTKKVYHAGTPYYLRKGKWYSEGGTPQLSDSSDLLNETWDAKQALKAEILAMKPGDEVHYTAKPSGKVVAFRLEKNGTLFNITANKKAMKSLDHYADYPFKSNGDKYDIKVLSKGESTEDLPPKGQQFVHPVSGAVFPLESGDKVYKHKSTDNGYIIVKGSGDKPVNFFTQNGKQQQPKESQKNLAKSYTEITDWPGKVEEKAEPTPPSSAATEQMVADAQPEDLLYIYKGSDYFGHYKKLKFGGWLKVGGEASVGNLSDSSMSYMVIGSDPKWSFQFYPKGSEPSINGSVDATPDLIKNAIPGDSILLKNGNGVPVVKQQDGTWKESGDDSIAWGEDMIVSVLSDNYHFIPAPTSPWGGKEAAGAPQMDPEPVTTKPTKGKKEALPKSVTLPDGGSLDLKPGEVYAKTEGPYGQTYFIHVTAGSKKKISNVILNEDGSSAYWPNGQKMTPASLKSYIKKNGGEVIGENIPPADKIDFSQYDSVALPENYSDIYQYVSGVVSEFPIALNWYGGIQAHSTYPQFNDESWYNLDNQQRLGIIASYEDIVGPAVASLQPVAKMDALEKSEKQMFGKSRSAFEFIHRAALVARELENPDTTWDDDKFDAEISFIGSKASKPGLTVGGLVKDKFPIDEIHSILFSANTQRKFKNSLTSLDFDPYNGTTEEYDAYAKANGFQHLSALNEDMQKLWVLDHLGDPTLNGSQKNIVKQAASKAATKIAVVGLAQTMEKSHAEPVAKPSGVKGLYEKAMLKHTYAWKSDKGLHVSIDNVGPDEWKMTTETADGGISTMDATDSTVFGLINSVAAQGTDIKTSEELAYGPTDLNSAMAKLETKLGYKFNQISSWDDLATFIGSLGGSLSGSDPSYIKAWLIAHAKGDEIAKFYIERASHNGSHPKGDSHMGSPSNNIGLASHKALAEVLYSKPAGQKYLKGEPLNKDDKKELADLVGFDLNGEQFIDSLGTYDTFSMWEQYHPQGAIALHTSGSVGKSVALKPGSVPDEVWAAVNGIEEGTDLSSIIPADAELAKMSDADLTQALSTNNTVKNAGLISPLLGAIPVNMKRLALWAANDPHGDEYREGFLHAITAKAKAGEWLDESTPAWIAPDGAKYPISPGASVYKVTGDYYGDYYVVTGPPTPDGTPSTDGWQFKENGQAPTKMGLSAVKQLTSGSTGQKVFTMPGAVQFDQAQKEIPDLTQSHWDEALAIEEGKSSIYTYPESGALLTAALKNNPTLEQNYPHLYAQHKSLPENVRQGIMAALTGPYQSPALLDLMEFKASKGHYASIGSKGLFDAGQPWLKHLSKGQTNEEHILNSWSNEAKDAYVQHFGIGDWGNIAPHLDGLLNPQTLTVSKALPKFEDLVLTPTGKSLGGMHSKQVLVDQDGNEWMSKAFNSDPNSKARVDAETGAVRVGRLYGFRTPVANTQAVPGQKYAYLQYLAPAVGDLSGKNPKDLTQKQLQQAMEEHLLDWIVANHDTHSQNLMLAPSGEVFGIDKGQAFKHFPKDKLAVGYLPPENGAPVWYDQFYNGIINGQIDKATADEVTKHVLRRAQKISKDLDAEFRAELETAFQHRDFWPDQYPTREKFIDGLVERKHNAFDDFVAFYKSVYEKSPYEWDIDTENLVPPMLDDHTHISASQDFADDVKKAGVHGKAIFFHSSDLEDSHIITSTATDKDGSTLLTGEAKVRSDGDKALTNWLSKQTIVGGTVHQQVQTYDDYQGGGPVKVNPSELPGNAEWFSAMVAGSKTVSSHNKSGDHEYNQGTLNNMGAAASMVGDALLQLEEWKKNHPDEPFKGSIDGAGNFSKVNVDLHSMEQTLAWEEMLNTYADYAKKVEAHKGTDQKISPHFTQFTYNASPKIVAEVEAKQNSGKTMTPFHESQISEILKDAKNGDVITYTNPDGAVTLTKEYGGWKSSTNGLMITSDLLDSNIAKDESTKDFSYSGFVPEYVEPDPKETSSTVTVGTKVLKVIKKPNSMKNGTYNFDTGELKMTGGETTKFQKGFQMHGMMYEIDFGNTVIEYRPHGDGIPLTQQGLLRFHKKDWSGDPESVEEIFDVLRQMGLSLDPATETSMELFYWKHQYGILNDRVDRNESKWTQLHADIKAQIKPGMTPEEELKVFKAAWAKALGQDVVDNADWMPKFSRQRTFAQGDGEFTTGHPYWHRADYKISDIQKFMGDDLPATSLTYGGNAHDALPIALSGSMLSAEERARYYGSVAKGGASSDSDQGYGSSGQVYIKPRAHGSDHEVYYHPRILLRTHNYSFDGDHYGKVADKKSYSYFDPKKSMNVHGELMVKNAVSAMDDIIMLKFPDEMSRKQAIKAYKDAGIDTLHGLPIEEIFVTNMSGLAKVRSHVYAEAIKAEQGEQKNVA